MNNLSDTVSVRLTLAGRTAAGSAPLAIHGIASQRLEFAGDAAQDVHVTVWTELAKTAPFGEPWFELAPEATAAEAHESAEMKSAESSSHPAE